MLEAGVDVRTIQALMGHNCIRTTVKYLHLTERRLSAIRSPLELVSLERAGLEYLK
jgi:site-specific recombinase XerD